MRNSQAKKRMTARAHPDRPERLGPFPTLLQLRGYSEILVRNGISHALVQGIAEHYIEVAAESATEVRRLIQEAEASANAQRQGYERRAIPWILLWTHGLFVALWAWLRGLDRNAQGELVYKPRSELRFLAIIATIVAAIVALAWLGSGSSDCLGTAHNSK
jgi:hypothetical protein